MRVLVVTRWPKQRLLLTGGDASTISVLIAKSGGGHTMSYEQKVGTYFIGGGT